MSARRAAVRMEARSWSPDSSAEQTGTYEARTPTRSKETIARTARRSGRVMPATSCREPKWCIASPDPRGSSAPKAMNWTGSSAGCCAAIRASWSMTAMPEALSSAPGAVGTVSRWAPTTTCGFRESKPGGSAITFADLPRLTGVPQEFPAGTRTVVRRTSYLRRSNLASTRSAASAKLSDVASRGPMSVASERTSRSAALASIVGSRGLRGVDVADCRG
ncbi:MAG: hypothetical protein K0S98_2796 [Propionibacteriaceae bacterium]|nr:hypothetical protein [Propionibacteriaceae bacterium]